MTIWKSLAIMATTPLLVVGLMGSALLGATGDARAGGIHYQTANMHDFDTGEDVAGAGTLTRSMNEVWAAIRTSDLDRDAAYTIWWVVFNNPDACSDPCGLNDLDVLDVNASVFYAAGFVTGRDGTANVDAHLSSGELPAGIDVLIPGGLMPGNGLGAEVHMIVRSHGAIITGEADVQIGTFNGACDINTCEDQQAVAFLPVE